MEYMKIGLQSNDALGLSETSSNCIEPVIPPNVTFAIESASLDLPGFHLEYQNLLQAYQHIIYGVESIVFQSSLFSEFSHLVE